MQSTLASVLLITAAVVLSCIAVQYAIAIMESSNFNEIGHLIDYSNLLRNQTSTLLNQTSIIDAPLIGGLEK